MDITRRENYQRSRENTAQQLHLLFLMEEETDRREGKGRRAVWGTDLNAALAI